MVKVVPRISPLQIENRYEVQLSGGGGLETIPRRVTAAAHDLGYNAIEPLVALASEKGACIDIRDISNIPVQPSPFTSSALEALLTLRARAVTQAEDAAAFALVQTVQGFRARRGAPVQPEHGSALEAALAEVANWP